MKMEIWMSRLTATIFQFCFVYSLQYLTHDLTSSSKLIQMLAESLTGKKMHLKNHKSKENGMVIIGGGVRTGEDCHQRRRNFSQTNSRAILNRIVNNNNSISWNIISL